MPVARLNGIEINYEVHGEGAPLVLAHGYTASLRMWDGQIPALSERYRLAIYDTRGHGASAAPEDMEAYGLAREYVADQLALMDHLGIERAHVGGLSMGGMIAQEFALQHPERLISLLLLDTGPGVASVARDPAVQQRFEQFRGMMQKLAPTQGMNAIVDAMRSSPMAMSMGGRGNGPMPEPVRAHLANMANMSVDGYLGGAKAMQDWTGTLDRLHAIKVPTLVLVGQNDNLLSASRAIWQRIEGARFVLLRDCWHGSNMWRPEAFLQAVTSFLDDVEAGRPVAGEVTL